LELGEVLSRQEVALQSILEILLPVDPDRAGDVAAVVGGRVLIDLEQLQVRIFEVLSQPTGLYQHIVGVPAHLSLHVRTVSTTAIV
jgi:hypothetical protein